MPSPLDDCAASNSGNPAYQRILSQLQGDWVNRLNIDQMFILIDGVLPFEACLYYQVLPLFIEGSRLNLGMVSPEDPSALDYVRRIVSYLNYSLVSRQISSEALRVTLTAYLNYVGRRQAEGRRQVFGGGSLPAARASVEPKAEHNQQQMFVLNGLEDLAMLNFDPQSGADFRPSPQLASVQPGAVDATEQETISIASREPINLVEAVAKAQPDAVAAPPSPAQAPGLSDSPPSLELQAKYLSGPVDILATLPPEEMLQELLARVLLGGIGRLFFERHAQYGRVLWSQNGVLQSVLDRLSPSLFNGLIKALKQMAHLPLPSVRQAEQAETAWLYNRNRVLLRFRVMPGPHGEEATLQVLRGAALKFYQRQQISQLERDALVIAKQLQSKLTEIRDRLQPDPGLPDARFDLLPALNQLVETMERQLNAVDMKLHDKPADER